MADSEIVLTFGLIVGLIASRFFSIASQHDLRGLVLVLSIVVACAFGLILQQAPVPRSVRLILTFGATITTMTLLVRRWRGRRIEAKTFRRYGERP